MISIIIPTIWASSKLESLVDKLESSNSIDEIILINNKIEKTRSIRSNKLIEVRFNKNQYVNPSWNYGVRISKNDKICILNDDIDIDIEVFDFMNDSLDRKEVGIVGISKSCYKERSSYFLEKMEVRNRGWGCCIFTRKENYHNIPDDLKIWFGDDWLIKSNDGKCFKIHGPKIDTDMSESSDLSEVKKIIDDDIQNSIKYQLPWSNDFGD